MSLVLSISHGSPIGGQPIVITGNSGEDFGANPGAVSLGGLACAVASWAASEIEVTTPPRRTADGVYIRTADTVALTVTDAEGNAHKASYAYTVTVYDQALAQISTALAQLDRAKGDNFTVSAGQIIGFQTQDILTGAEWPMFDFFGGELEFGESGSDTPYGFDTGTFPFFLRGTMPLSAPANWDLELRALARDMHRAIRRARNADAVALEIRVDSFATGKLDSDAEGGMGAAIIRGTIIAKHINCDMNTTTQGE